MDLCQNAGRKGITPDLDNQTQNLRHHSPLLARWVRFGGLMILGELHALKNLYN